MEDKISSKLEVFGKAVQNMFLEQDQKNAQHSYNNALIINDFAQHIGDFATTSRFTNRQGTPPPNVTDLFPGTPSMLAPSLNTLPLPVATTNASNDSSSSANNAALVDSIPVYDMKENFHSVTEVYNAWHGLGDFSFGNLGCFQGGFEALESSKPKIHWRKGWSASKAKYFSRVKYAAGLVPRLMEKKSLSLVDALKILDDCWRIKKGISNFEAFCKEQDKEGRLFE